MQRGRPANPSFGLRVSAEGGKGYSRFATDAHAIAHELTVCVSPDDTVKLQRLRLCNRSALTRHMSVTAYVEWAVGANCRSPAPFVITARDAKNGALFARNRWRSDYADRVAFIDMGGLQQSIWPLRRLTRASNLLSSELVWT